MVTFNVFGPFRILVHLDFFFLSWTIYFCPFDPVETKHTPIKQFISKWVKTATFYGNSKIFKLLVDTRKGSTLNRVQPGQVNELTSNCSCNLLWTSICTLKASVTWKPLLEETIKIGLADIINDPEFLFCI